MGRLWSLPHGIFFTTIEDLKEAAMAGAQAIRYCVIFFLILSSPAYASSLKTVPVQLFFDAGTKATVLRVTNEGGEKVTVQLDAREWRQDESGEDVYEETRDIVFFPKMADIDKGEERIVRVGYQGLKALSREKTYRLFLQELPVTRPGETALKFAMRIGIPIFIKPQKEIIEWAIGGVGFSERSLTVRVKNSGNAHLFVSKIRATGLDDSGKAVFSREMRGWYALAGALKPFAMAVSREECVGAKTIKVAVEVEKTGKEATLAVVNSMCTMKQGGSKDVRREGIQR
jgi:fimbrial chaperone protein